MIARISGGGGSGAASHHISHSDMASGKRSTVSHTPHASYYMGKLAHLYHSTLNAGDHAAQYWADVSVNSRHLLGPLAAVPGVMASLWSNNTVGKAYTNSTRAGAYATQYWANMSVNSKSPLAPLAAVPGMFAALWTPETAPSTAITLGPSMYGFARLPGQLTHFTTEAGALGIARDGAINASAGTFAKIPRLGGLFGPGVYMARLGRPANFFIRAAAKTPIMLQTPAGTVRVIPYLVYVRWGAAPLILP